MKKIRPLFLVLLLMSFHTNAQQKALKITKNFHIKSSGGWDYLAVSPLHNWLYISHGTQVNVIDKKTGDSVSVIPNTTGVHGIAFDVANKKGFTSNGKLNNVSVFDMDSKKVLAQISVGKNPDFIMYEPFLKKIITCNGKSNNLSIIDPIQNKLIDSVSVGGKPETAVTDGKGNLFVNIEDKSEIVKVDLKSLKVTNRWSLKPGEEPSGLAFDPKTKRLFATCDKLLVILNAENGKIVDKIAIGEGTDGAVFDETTKNIYTSNGEGTLSVIHENSADKYSLIQTLTTKKGARTIALDPETHLLYLPTADFDAKEKDSRGRPKMIAGSFQVLVVGI